MRASTTTTTTTTRTRTKPTSSSWTIVQICGGISFICSLWNLMGDLYYMDFYYSHMAISDDEQFANISTNYQNGLLFRFHTGFSLVAFFAQAGGWMYPIWSMTTAIPIYLGLRGGGQYSDGGTTIWTRSFIPCILLVYGMCIIGGALHSAFSFLTVLPNIYHHHPPTNITLWDDDDNNNDDDYDASLFELKDNKSLLSFLNIAQQRMVQHIVIGCLPGVIATILAMIWIAYLVHNNNKSTHFPMWYNLFNPMVTSIWVQLLGVILPYPIGFYFVGCQGTWGLLIMNMATTYYLWNLEDSQTRSCLLLLLEKTTIPASTESSSRLEYGSFS